MLEITSSGCGKYNQPEFRLRFDPELALERDDRELDETLEGHVASGQKIMSGQYLRFGWMGLHFHELTKHLLAVQEPDLRGFPVQFVDSVTATLRHLRWQKDCAVSVGVPEPLSFPTMFQSAAICRRLAPNQPFLMERKPPTDDDSGWFIGCSDVSHEHGRADKLVRASLYEIVLRFHQAVAAFLALPAGTKVLNTLQG